MICDYYEKRNIILEHDQIIAFRESKEDSEISLDIPFPCSTGVTCENNQAWRILALTPPVVRMHNNE